MELDYRLSDFRIDRLQRRHAEDLQNFAQQHPDFAKYWRPSAFPWPEGHPFSSLSGAQSWLDHLNQKQTTQEAIYMGVWEAQELQAIFGADPIHWGHRQAQIGFWTRNKIQANEKFFWEAFGVWVKKLLEGQMLHRLELQYPESESSEPLLHLGFKLEGTLRQAWLLEEGFVNMNVFARLRGEF